MTSKSEIGRELRLRTYQYGPSVYRTVKGNNRAAVLEAAKLSHHYAAEGLAFHVGDKLPSKEWPIMVDAAPLLNPDQMLLGSEKNLSALAPLWGVVLVWSYGSQTAATSRAHKANSQRNGELSEIGSFKSRRIGLADPKYGVFFHRHDIVTAEAMKGATNA